VRAQHIRNDHYSIEAIKRVLLAKGVLQEGEIEAAAKEIAHFEFEENKKFAAEWWKQIKIGDQVKYNGYEGTVVSISTEPWQGLVIQTKKKGLLTFTMVSKSLLVRDIKGSWSQCAE